MGTPFLLLLSYPWDVFRRWVAGAMEPSNAPKPEPHAPKVGIELSWVHGCNAQLARGSLGYSTEGAIIYPVANVVVVYDKRTHQQRHFREHHREVLSVCVAPNMR